MKVILTNEVLGLGDPGDVVKVKTGYGRNYLIPQGLALEATYKNIKSVESDKKRIAAAQAREAEKVRGEAGKLAGVKVAVTARAGEGGRLYGSVTNMQVAAALAEQGFDIDRRRIIQESPIKQLGEYTLKVKLHPQVVVDIKLEVLPEAQPEAPAAGPEPAAAGQEAETAQAADQPQAAAEEEPKE
ncbi:MAG: 50S ribosomal protein L9 [Desulfarculus sp.]|nr:MAG: 50S ribosomal protein L9 [Desulfarculus sp.]